jgi:phosphoglycolate phosphatase
MINDSIIFDIDGTLWDACSASAQGWNNGLKELDIGNKVTANDIRNVAGHTFRESVEILCPGLIFQYPNLGDILEKSEIEAIRNSGGVFYDGVIDGIQRLAAAYRIFIVSNCQEWYLRILLDRAGIEKLVEGYDCNGLSNLPKGRMLARLKNKYSLENPVYIGDTASDEEATQLAGMEFIHAGYGFGSPKNNPRSFDSFSSLTNYFLDRSSLANSAGV